MLTLDEDPSTSCFISWRTDTTVLNGFVEIAVASPSPFPEENAEKVEAETQKYSTYELSANVHKVRLTTLQPGTPYIYRVGVGGNWSEWFQFKTAKEMGAFSFLYFGDTQAGNREVFSRNIRMAYKTCPNTAFMLFAGDIVNTNTDNEWGDWYSAGGWIYASTPTIATPGNHEYYTPDKAVKRLTPYWNTWLNFPQNGSENTKGTSYYVDYQGTRFISVNTSQFRYEEDFDEEHVIWIENLLKENPYKWTVVFQHHPNYVARKGPENDKIRKLLIPLYNKYGVDLVLQGHDHTYGRGIPEGNEFGAEENSPVYVVSVCGNKMYDLSFNDWVDRCASKTQMFQHISIDNNKLTFEAYTADGMLYDEFEVEKLKNGKRNYIDKQPLAVKERVELPRKRVIKEKWNRVDSLDYYLRYESYLKRKGIKN